MLSLTVSKPTLTSRLFSSIKKTAISCLLGYRV
nr:MAG TPA: hypothetical protein [Caudoviricetes sp.]